MYLKSIEVQGFKSFVHKTVFEFHNGITGIVGPNGSGKSNVADAVRWVLGEQRAKQLRGSNMQDVIFAGTENRKPLGFASVAITLDNADHQLPIEYEEVTVTRRVYRSGESEYLINGSGCRLKDVYELFYDTGIGKEGYSIIGQGQIDRILSGKPEERRELFDEAAGIVKFKRRKATAQKKLEDEKQNLVRVCDILSELEKQLGPLEKQSETARAYLKKKEELKIYDVNMFLMESERISGELSKIEENLKNAQTNLEQSRSRYEGSKQEYERIETKIEQIAGEIETLKEQAGTAHLEKQQMEGQIGVLKEQINTDRMNDEHLQNRIGAIEKEIREREASRSEYAEDKARMDEQLQEAGQVRTEAEAALLEVQQQIAQITALIDQGKSEVIELLNQRASTKGKLQRYDTMTEQIQIRRAELNQRLLRNRSHKTEQDSLIHSFQEELDQVTGVIGQLNTRRQEAEERIEQLQEQLSRQNEQQAVGQSAYHREVSRLEALRNITERYDGYGNSIRRVMEQKDREKGIHGVVADLIKVEKTYETAIETALGGSIQNIVTDDEETAKRMIEYLKQNKYGRATFLPLTSIKRREQFQNDRALKEPGVIGLASDLVHTQEKYRELAGYLLGRTIVTDHIDHAIALARKYHYSLRIVTVEGESLSPGGSMTGGAFKNSSNLLGRRREIEELEANVKLLKADLEKAGREIEQAKKNRTSLYTQIDEIKGQIQEQYILRNTAGLNKSQAETRKEELQNKYLSLKSEGEQIEVQLQAIQENKLEIQKEIAESEAREKELEAQTLGGQARLETFHEQEAKRSKKAEAIRLEYANLKQKDEFITQNIGRIDAEMKKLLAEKSELSRNVGETADGIREKEEQIQKLQQRIIQTEGSFNEYDKKIETLTREKEQQNEQHKALFVKREELSGQISLLDKETYRLASQKEKLEDLSLQQSDYMWQEYELTYGMAAPMRNEELKSAAEIKRGINRLKEEIRKLGDVNVNAIEDFKNLSERYEFLKTQHDDLVKAEESLMGIIAELDEGMRRQFTEKFEQIRLEFDKAFKELFGGGKASLALTEEEDILEAGIRIIAQPPGKKLQSMVLLSGGEKALTAIALLFAIQNLKPSPFCLLDEIEAALDDSNVGRFAHYLHKLTKNTQFIIITHRRGTMAAADRLYGITMQEKGVSTLVSVDLIEGNLDK